MNGVSALQVACLTIDEHVDEDSAREKTNGTPTEGSLVPRAKSNDETRNIPMRYDGLIWKNKSCRNSEDCLRVQIFYPGFIKPTLSRQLRADQFLCEQNVNKSTWAIQFSTIINTVLSLTDNTVPRFL